MHLDLEAQPLEQAVQIQLPPRSVVLLWSSISEPASQITVRIWNASYTAQAGLERCPNRARHAIEKGERVLSMASWARLVRSIWSKSVGGGRCLQVKGSVARCCPDLRERRLVGDALTL